MSGRYPKDGREYHRRMVGHAFNPAIDHGPFYGRYEGTIGKPKNVWSCYRKIRVDPEDPIVDKLTEVMKTIEQEDADYEVAPENKTITGIQDNYELWGFELHVRDMNMLGGSKTSDAYLNGERTKFRIAAVDVEQYQLEKVKGSGAGNLRWNPPYVNKVDINLSIC